MEEATSHIPHRTYGIATPVDISPEETAVRQLRARGIHPEKVRWILSIDQIITAACGIRTTIVCRTEAWSHVAGKSGLAGLRAFLLPGHLPDDVCARLQLLPGFNKQVVGTFPASYDLFNDGTIQLIDLPGHLPGHIGAWINGRKTENMRYLADAVWTLASTDGPGRVHGWLANDWRQQNETYRIFGNPGRHPMLPLFLHCPLTAGPMYAIGFNKDHRLRMTLWPPKISGMGCHLPERVSENDEIEHTMHLRKG